MRSTMRIISIALTAVTASAAIAQPHVHKHRHLKHHEHVAREVEVRDVTKTAWAPGSTAYVYMLNGKEISADEVCEGLEDNELKFVDGQDPGVCSKTSSWSSSTTTTSSTTSSTTTTTAAASSAPAAGFYPSSMQPWSQSSAAASSSAAAPSQQPWTNTGGSGVNSPFPDGQLDCSDFPSQYGAVPLSYLGLGGWSGVQNVQIAGGLVNHIVTAIAGGPGCTEGSLCSYACPPGYQKAQWPSTQGATGQSVGGISCSGGKLHLTNPDLSRNLCIAGSGDVQAQNNAGSVVSICRTDYPGTESETIPLELQPGETEELTCPIAESYYQWQGKSTSAQYYLNPIGTPASVGCQWASPGGNVGNFAPINFGVGAKGGTTWLSIFQNAPTTNAQYQGTVELKGNLSGTCKYSNGQYCGVTGCNAQGCTVSVISGTATYVISN